MKNDIEKFEEEQKKLAEEIKKLDFTKNQILLRLAEIQGVLKFLREKDKKSNGEKKL